MSAMALNGKIDPVAIWHYVQYDWFVPGKRSEGLEARGVHHIPGFGYQGRRLMSTGYLIAPDGHWWLARSGGKEKGTLPHGMYKIGRVTRRNAEKRPTFTDKSGFCWFCQIWHVLAPAYGKEDPLGRDHFGIHPDGGSRGTEGCIGIAMENTRRVYEALKQSDVRRLKVGPTLRHTTQHWPPLSERAPL